MPTHTLVIGDLWLYDPDDAALTPLTIQMPDSTDLVEGVECGIMNYNRTSTTTVVVNAHSSSSSDLIQNPTSLNSAYATSHATLTLQNYVVWWRLINVTGTNTWRVSNKVP